MSIDYMKTVRSGKNRHVLTVGVITEKLVVTTKKVVVTEEKTEKQGKNACKKQELKKKVTHAKVVSDNKKTVFQTVGIPSGNTWKF